MSSTKKVKSFLEAETKFTGKYASSVLDTLWIAYRPYATRFFLSLAFGFLGRMCLLGNANLIGIWVDSFCDPLAGQKCKGTPAFFQNFSNTNYILLLLGLTLLGFCLILFFRVVFSRLSAQAVSQIYDETTFRTSRMPMSFFDSTPAGRIITRFSSDYGNIFRLFGGPLAELLSIVFDLLAMVILIGLASPIYLPIVFFVGVLDYFIFKMNIQKMRDARRALSQSRSPSIAHFSETAQGASTIRSFLKQKSFASRFEKLDRDYLKNKLDTMKSVQFFSLQINATTALFLLATGFLAWQMVDKGYLSVGSVAVAFSFIALSGNTVQMFFEWVSQFEEAMVGVERLDQYLRKELEPGAKLPPEAQFDTGHPRKSKEELQAIQNAKFNEKQAAAVDFNEVDFRYRKDLPLVLKELKFSIQAGERFGIIGRTGSGKSSLIQALLHLYPIEKGYISIDGLKPKINPELENSLDLEVYRKSIAFIAQDPTLFKGNLRDNLLISSLRPALEQEELMISALKRVGLDQWASKQGLNYPVEEKGRNLSQGEKQLVSMARCLLQNAPVVIMDEATSSVDPQSEEILVRATEEIFHGKTQIIIAHRLSTLLNCDRILWLHNGAVKMIAPPSEVLPLFQNTKL
jgi:ABC-type multidrug transport system fused ATPase/permease subunit